MFRKSAQYGQIVRTSVPGLGAGKVVSATATQVDVEFFHSAASQEVRTFPRSAVSRVPVSKQTRCYLFNEDEGQWQAGRIGERDGREYEINLPGQSSIWLDEAFVYVRSAQPVNDPTDVLAARAHETAFYHEPRHRLSQALIRQRATARGITGLLSARIELYPHQVEVARRVLTDPIQRYLLADEVGLGKTIEAGILIRQFLLDEPSGRVLVLVPILLCEQWRRELNSRFDAFASNRVTLVSTSKLNDVPRDVPWGMLVIDEAHHIATGAYSADTALRQAWHVCQHLSAATDRVILLSATPAASHEEQFLAMLHLLEPTIYRLDDIESFKRRVALRREIGRVLLTITERTPDYPLRLALEKLRALFPDDDRLETLRGELTTLLGQARVGEPRRTAVIRAIRAHVSETYRLHRRMLRNRRRLLTSAVGARSNYTLKQHAHEGTAVQNIYEALEDWRGVLAQSLSAEPALPARDYARLFASFAAAAGSTPSQLGSIAAKRLKAAEDGRVEPPLLREEEIVLPRIVEEAREEACHNDDKSAALVSLLRRLREQAGSAPPPKCVVFSEYTETCALLNEKLRTSMNSSATAACYRGPPLEVIEEEVQRFTNKHDCFVLLCDPSGEEGRNLQFAEHLILFDLPWVPNQLEQRIGRVDRIGRTRDLTIHVFTGLSASAPLAHAWYSVLRDGLQIFAEPVTGIQFYVDAKTPALWEAALMGGADALLRMANEMPAEISAEQLRLDEHAAVDEIDADAYAATSYSAGLDRLDMCHAQLRDDVESWFCRVLQFEHDGNHMSVVKYRAGRQTLVPEDVVAKRFSPFLNRRSTYDRNTSSRDPSVALLRLGEGLTDALSSYLRWDDRGQAFAIWRLDPAAGRSEGSEWLAFMFHFVVEANTDGAKALLAASGLRGATPASLRRRGDSWMAPWLDHVVVDASGKEITDEPRLSLICRPFCKNLSDGSADFNLTKDRLSALDRVVATDRWEELCRSARLAAGQHFVRRAEFRERCERAAAVGAERQAVLEEQLELRTNLAENGNGPRAEALRELRLERELGEALIAGVADPNIRVDSIGMVIVAGYIPDELASCAGGTTE